ncbi:MAG: transglutaminase domain-containing protein [Cryomorphaceae bacterium]
MGVFAQTPDDEFSRLKEKYPKKDYAYTKFNWDLQLSLTEDGVMSTLMREEERMCLNGNGGLTREGSITYSGFASLNEKEVVTMIPNGGKYKKQKVTGFTEYDIGSGNSFYDDEKTIKYYWPNVNPGAKQYQKVVIAYNDPHFTPSFFLPPYIPVNEGSFKLTVDEDIDIEFTPFNFEDFEPVFSEEERRGKRVLTWNFNGYEATKYQKNNGPELRFTPHILVRIRSFEGKYGAERVLTDASDLHNWYCSILKKEEDDLSEVTAIVDEVTREARTDLEAAQLIYQWVQRNIKYILISDGMKGFQPEAASVVCSNRFGDCKGMSNLLHAMYQSIGFDSKLTWVGTRDILYSYDEVPTPMTDNHMILTLDLDGERYILDATHSRLPFGMPSPMIQGKQVMISHDCESFELQMMPLVSADENQIVDSIECWVHDDDVSGKGVATFTGFSKMMFLEGQSSSDANYLKRYTREYLLKGSNRFVIDSLSFEGDDDPNIPLKVNYTFRIDDLLTQSGDEKYLNFNMSLKGFESQPIEKDMQTPFQLRFRTIAKSVATLHFNDDEEVTIPENFSLENELYSFHVNYSQSKGQITRVAEDLYNFIDLYPTDFNDWNDYIKEVKKANRQNLIITVSQD